MAEFVTPTKVSESGRIKRCAKPIPTTSDQQIKKATTVYRPILPKPVEEPRTLNLTRTRTLPRSITPQIADHVINDIGNGNNKLKDKARLPLNEKELTKLKSVITPSVKADQIAKVIKEIEPLWSAVRQLFIQDIKDQSSSLCKKGEGMSILRAGTKCYDKIRKFEWNDVLNELLQRAPDVADVLTSIAVPKPVKTKERCESIVPPLCMSWAILINIRNPELSLVQKTLTCILGVSGCNKVTIKRLNALKLCQSHQNWLRCMDDIGANLEGTIKRVKSTGSKARLIFDNFDFKIHAGEMLKGIRNIDNHWLCQYMTFDRMDTCHLDNTKPLGDLKDMDITMYLLTEEEQQQMRHEYIVLVARILTKYIPWLKGLTKYVPDHIEHKYSQEMSQKSVIISLPVKPYDQKKNSDVIQYLDSVQTFLKEINEEEEPLIQMPLGGDLLGRERVTSAKKLRSGCDEPEEKFDNIVEVAEYWHAKQSLLSLCWKHLYKQSSGREAGTLYYFRNLHGRTNVKAKVKSNYAAAEGLLLHLATAHIICAFMHYAGMEDLNARPTNIREPGQRITDQNFTYIDETVGKFVDKYCLFEPDTDKLLRRQKEKEQQDQNQLQNGSIAFLLTRKDDGNYEFEAIGFVVNSDDTALSCHVVQVLRTGATQYGSEQLIQPGTIVNWPKKLVAFNNPKKKCAEQEVKENINTSIDDDYKTNYGLWIIQFGMLLMQMNDTEKEGDGERALRNNKLLLLMFRTGPHGKKYAFEMLRMISKVNCQMTAQMSERTIHGRFVNWKGGKGNNCANDLKQEHLVKFTKKLVRGMGAQKTEQAVKRATSAAGGLQYITENFDKVTSIPPESTAHTYKNADADIMDMISIITDQKIFKTTPGRAHPSFPNLTKSVLDTLNVVKMEQWMKRWKSKLAKNPDMPWDSNLDSDDEDDGSDSMNISLDSDDDDDDCE